MFGLSSYDSRTLPTTLHPKPSILIELADSGTDKPHGGGVKPERAASERERERATETEAEQNTAGACQGTLNGSHTPYRTLVQLRSRTPRCRACSCKQPTRVSFAARRKPRQK